jgi:hypothetical protein
MKYEIFSSFVKEFFVTHRAGARFSLHVVHASGFAMDPFGMATRLTHTLPAYFTCARYAGDGHLEDAQ